MGDRTLSKVLDVDREPGTADTVAASPNADVRAGRRREAEAFAALADDHYELGDEVARGGMGKVIRAFDRRLGRIVAVKLLVDDTPSRRERFAREAQITARLQHPSIVPIYEAGVLDSGELAYAMKLVSGRDLQAALDDTTALADRLPLLPRIIDVVEAIAYAHGQGVMHRDLKPSNIVLGEFGETVVIDWGVAKELDDARPISDERPSPTSAELTRPGSVVGTPAYMAPEQAAGEQIDGRADVYALGAILSHVLTGTRPYAGADGTTVLGQVMAGPPVAVDTLEPHVPAELAAIVRRAMARDPAARYDARELADELRRFTAGQLVAAHRYTLAERVVRWTRRHRAAVVVGVIAVALLAVVAIDSTRRILRERDRAEEARSREAARADDLLVARAATVATTNPTSAVGLLHQLPDSATSWRAARDVLASARTRGVPWAFPASQGTSGLVVTRDGKLAYSVGSDGVVRRLDLVRNTTDVIFHVSGAGVLALSPDEATLALAGKTPELIWLDLATSRETRVAVAAPIEAFATDGAAMLAWFDKHDDVWLIDHHGSTPRRVISMPKLGRIAMAPDGKHLALSSSAETLVFDLRGDEPQLVVRHAHSATNLAWSSDGLQLAVPSFRGLDEINFDGVPAIRHVRPDIAFVATYVGDDLYYSTNQSIVRDRLGTAPFEEAVPHETYDWVSNARDAAVFSSLAGVVVVVGRGGLAVIRPPASNVFRAAASRDASQFLISTTDHLLRYELDAVLGRPLPIPVGAGGLNAFYSNDQFIAGDIVGDWHTYELATGKLHSLGKLGVPKNMGSELSGAYLLVRAENHDLLLVRPDQPPVSLGANMWGIPVSPAIVELIGPNEVTDLTVGSLARRTAWTAPDHTRIGATRNGHIAVATAHVVWRRLAVDGRSETITMPGSITAVALAPDGTAYIATGTTIHSWAPDGALEDYATLAHDVAAFAIYDRVGVLVADNTGVSWHVVPGQPPTHALPEDFRALKLAADAPLVVGVSHLGELQIYDLETHYAWSLGTGARDSHISPDGRHVATLRDDAFVIVTVDLPQDRAGYERLLSATTNLRAGDTPNEIVWPP